MDQFRLKYYKIQMLGEFGKILCFLSSLLFSLPPSSPDYIHWLKFFNVELAKYIYYWKNKNTILLNKRRVGNWQNIAYCRVIQRSENVGSTSQSSVYLRTSSTNKHCRAQHSASAIYTRPQKGLPRLLVKPHQRTWRRRSQCRWRKFLLSRFASLTLPEKTRTGDFHSIYGSLIPLLFWFLEIKLYLSKK